ncbi:hypothetical protein NDU88_007960 [Pleurodeles waltl]|uniref:Reverse transcriptase domain-containing protein n=1 Tax=Pleurodeles waltl TaxID=8319 RepID=A0AAV7SU76_PLEWA|nr:hypothetical protein NDU88_007960 [Pleurodeles waltl]
MQSMRRERLCNAIPLGPITNDMKEEATKCPDKCLLISSVAIRTRRSFVERICGCATSAHFADISSVLELTAFAIASTTALVEKSLLGVTVQCFLHYKEFSVCLVGTGQVTSRGTPEPVANQIDRWLKVEPMESIPEEMDTGAPRPMENSIPPVDAPKPNPNPPGVGSKVASKVDPPIASTSAGKAGEQKAPGPKQGNPESPTAAKPGGGGKGEEGTRQGTAPKRFNGYNLTRGHAQVMRWEVKDKAGPKLDRDLFLDKVIKPAGIPGEEVLSSQASASGWIFLLSFITHTLYRKYWEFCQGKKGEKPFNSFNKLSFYLGADDGRIRYPGYPFTCRKCQAVGHKGMDCPEKYCRICRQTGHETSRSTGKKVCNLWRDMRDLFQSAREWWEWVKDRFRSFFQDASRASAREKKRDFRQLQSKLQCLFKLKLRGWDVDDELEETQKGLGEHFREESRKIIFRTRTENLEKDEKCNSFFFKKLHSAHTLLVELRDSEGNLQSGKERAMRVVTDFYGKLYSPKSPERSQSDKSQKHILLHQALSPEERESLNAPFTLEELHLAATTSKRGKTPGSDGLPVEIYVELWDLIGPDLLDLYGEVVGKGSMPQPLREGMITLLYKQKGEKEDLRNWRPISFLNVDYKLLAKAIANRLKKVIKKIVHPDQTCGILGRQIADSLALVRDTIEYVKSRKVPMALVSLDQEKAFDRVSHEFMDRTLRALGLGDFFHDVVTAMSKDKQRQVRNATPRSLDLHHRPTAIPHQAGLPEDPWSLVRRKRRSGKIMGRKTGEDEAEAGTLEPPEADDRREVFGPAERDPASAPVRRTSVASAASNGQGHHENNLFHLELQDGYSEEEGDVQNPRQGRQRSAGQRHHPEGNLRMPLREEHPEIIRRKPCQIPGGTFFPVAKVEATWMGRVGERCPLQLGNPMVLQRSGEVH